MKKHILSLFVLASFYAKGQVVDTTVKNCVAVKIQPVIYKHDFPVITDTITHLGIFEYKVTDSSCNVSYTLLHHSPTKNIIFNWYMLTKQEVDCWGKDFYTLFQILANRYGLTFKND